MLSLTYFSYYLTKWSPDVNFLPSLSKTKAKAHSEFSETSKMELSLKIINGFQPLCLQKAPSKLLDYVLNVHSQWTQNLNWTDIRCFYDAPEILYIFILSLVFICWCRLCYNLTFSILYFTYLYQDFIMLQTTYFKLLFLKRFLFESWLNKLPFAWILLMSFVSRLLLKYFLLKKTGSEVFFTCFSRCIQNPVKHLRWSILWK